MVLVALVAVLVLVVLAVLLEDVGGGDGSSPLVKHVIMNNGKIMYQ